MCKAVILSAYGSGNLPISEENGALSALEAAVKREILVVVISQCACLETQSNSNQAEVDSRQVPYPTFILSTPKAERSCREGSCPGTI